MALSSKVSQALNDIVTKARQVDELAAEVAGASREQTEGIVQINTAVGQMDKVTQSNAASAEESAAAAQELNAQAELMKQSVAELLRLVGGQPLADPVPTTVSNHRAKPVRSVGPASNPRLGPMAMGIIRAGPRPPSGMNPQRLKALKIFEP